MSDGQSSQRISFSSPASVSVLPQTRQSTGPRRPRARGARSPVEPGRFPGAAEPGRRPFRKRLGRREDLPPGARESAQESVRCSLARVTPT